MCSSGQILFLPHALLQQMDEMSTFAILIYVAAIFVRNGQVEKQTLFFFGRRVSSSMCSSGQILFLPHALLQQMDEMSTFVILIYVAAIFVRNGQVEKQTLFFFGRRVSSSMCSSGQVLFLPRALLQQMDEMSTFAILIYVAAIFVRNGQVGYI
ncbi:hypothetical protein [Bacillus manliponensis]|uniref:hypothetical protein n=1 Tax=Bacillus manliponensis TaxID=574376 RepID=UPI0035189C1A